MRQKHPFLTRKGDGGFNRHTSPACKGDGGFTRETSGARGWWRGPDRHQNNAPNQTLATRPHWCGGRRRGRRHGWDWWAWLRCPWAVAGPGRASRRRAEPDNSDQAPLVWRAPEGPEGQAAVPVGGGGAWPGFETTRRAEGSRRGRLAGGPPPMGTPSSPARQGTQAPGTPVGLQATRQHTARGPKRRSASGPSRVSVAHRLSWMLRPGTASISSRV